MVRVTDAIRTLSATLRSRLSGDHQIATQPDHPNLFAGPDLLIGARGTLIAMFIPSLRDDVGYNDLLARLTASRIALPSRTVCVLLLGSSASEPPKYVMRNFEHTSGATSSNDLLQIIKSSPRSSVRHIPREVRNKAFNRFVLLSQFVAVRRRHNLEGRNPKEILREWRGDLRAYPVTRRQEPVLQGGAMYVSKETVESVEQRMRVPRDVVLQDDALAIAAKVFAGHTGSALSRTRSLCVYSLRKDFTLDQGIPYPHRFVPNMLVADRFPVMRADPEKPVRTLAFAGWVTVTLQDLGEISAIQKQLRRAAERRDVL